MKKYNNILILIAIFSTFVFARLPIIAQPILATIRISPNISSQGIGGTVAWTIRIENISDGPITNVVVSDDLGDGLRYSSSLPAGVNVVQNVNWTSTEVPALASINPGDIVSINISSLVVSCENLLNTANVSCNEGAYNTAMHGGTAYASVARIVKTPLISFTPPNISFNYGDAYVDVNFTLNNIGDGAARNIFNNVDFSTLTVSNVSAGAVYNNIAKRFELSNPINSGGHYDLSFRLNYASWCNAFPSGNIIWETEYEDDCGNKFYPPSHKNGNISVVGASGISANISGGAPVISIGDQVTYNITSSYSGAINCGSGSAGMVTVVATLANGFTAVDADGGTYIPAVGGTGGTVTWTYTPPATLSKNIVIQSPLLGECETYCHTTFTNTVSASVSDCYGCILNATKSQTSAIQCEELATVSKTATPSTSERCSDITYTNTYTFAPSANINLNDLVFEDLANNSQQYVSGTLSVVYDGSDISGSIISTDLTPGGALHLDFSGCPATALNNKILAISYQLTITSATASACSNSSFYSWSSMRVGAGGGNGCLAGGVIYEAVEVSVKAPAMSIDITGFPNEVDKCNQQNITVTLTQTSTDANPKDSRFVLSGANYYVLNPAATICGGTVSPVSCTPVIVGDDYVWTFNDGFDGVGKNATLTLDVVKRCTGSDDLVATAYFDDMCNDDATPDDICSVSYTAAPAILASGDLLIEQSPKIYYTSSNSVQWKINITNRGAGKAHNVWVDDVLGADLIYDIGNPAVVSGLGASVVPNQDHNGAIINGATILIPEIAAGERREITFNAILIGCNFLTNYVTANWGCGGLDCQSSVTDISTILIPSALMIDSASVASPVDLCSSPKTTVWFKNVGQTTCYNLQITETLPSGLTYIDGSTRWRLNSGAWNGPNASYNPFGTTSPIVWTGTEIPALRSLSPGDEIEVELDLDARCTFTGGNVTVGMAYENPCGQVFTIPDKSFAVVLNEPLLNVDISRVNHPIACGEDITWNIAVTNNSGYTLPIVWVEDVMDAAFTYVSSLGQAPYTSDNGINAGQKLSWELKDVPNGTTVNLSLTARTNSSPCSPDLDNTVSAWVGCGNADGSSSTKPGVDAPDNNLCLSSTSFSATRTETRQPSLDNISVGLSPATINSNNDNTTITFECSNIGSADALNLDIMFNLPTGLSYNTGSTLLYVGTDNTGVAIPIVDPTIVGSQLRFTDGQSKINNLVNTLQAIGGNDVLVLKFSVKSSCYISSSMTYNIYYYDCCSDVQYNLSGSKSIPSNYPVLTVTQSPTTSQLANGAIQNWAITVNNTGTGNAEVLRIEDTPGAWIIPDIAQSSAGLTNMGGGIWGWEINNLAAGASRTLNFVATYTPSGLLCTPALRQNSVRAIWGGGSTGEAIDGLPNTSNYDCTSSAWSNTAVSTINMSPPSITGLSTINSNFAGNVYSTEAGKSSYVWVVSAGGTITNGGGANDNTATITWNSAGDQSVSVNYTNSNGCTAESASIKSVSVRTSQAYVNSIYNAGTPGWGLDHFNDLSTAISSSSPNSTINVSNYLHNGAINADNNTFIIGAGDFVVNGAITATTGLIQAISTGYLIQSPAQGVEKVYPLTDGTNDCTVKIRCANAPTQPIKIKINNDKSVAGAIKANIDFIDISGEVNLNATVIIRIDKSAIAPTAISSNILFRYYNGSRYVPIPQDRVSIADLGVYYELTITGMNGF